MNTAYKFASLTVMMTFLAVTAAVPENAAATTLANLTEGQGVPASAGNPAWDGMSEVALIPGAALMAASSKTTALYLGFTGGTTVNVGNMVLYEVPRNSSKVLKVTKVTLGATQSPTIDLASLSTCPVAPSASTPCIVKLDTINLALSPLYDYCFAIYFTLDTNNETIFGMGQSGSRGGLSGFYMYGDQTRIGVDGALPIFESGDQAPFFLAYVTNE